MGRSLYGWAPLCPAKATTAVGDVEDIKASASSEGASLSSPLADAKPRSGAGPTARLIALFPSTVASYALSPRFSFFLATESGELLRSTVRFLYPPIC